MLDVTGQWQHWSTRVDEYHYPTDSTPEYSSILVPNVDNVRTTFLIQTISKQSKAVLLIGEQVRARCLVMTKLNSALLPHFCVVFTKMMYTLTWHSVLTHVHGGTLLVVRVQRRL